MPAPKVSIVIAAYKAERFLAETLFSIQAQSLQDWECVVVDDSSPDGTYAIAERFARKDSRIRAVTKANEGTVATRNHGFTLTNPDSTYVTFMDGDDLWMPEALKTLSDLIDTHPGAVGAYGVGRCIDENGNSHEDAAYTRNGNGRFFCDKWGTAFAMEASELTSFRSLWFSNPYPPGLVLARRSAYKKAGPFDKAIALVEDWDMLVRLSRFGGFCYVERTILCYRRHFANLSGHSPEINRGRLRSLQCKTFFSPENNAEQRRILKENWRATQFFHARQKWRAAASQLSEARFLKAAGNLLAACVQFCRFARGYPTTQGI